MKPNMKIIFSLLAASCLTSTAIQSTAWAQSVSVDSELDSESENSTSEEKLLDASAKSELQSQPAPVPIPLEESPQPVPIPIVIPLMDDNTDEKNEADDGDHSGHDHAAKAPVPLVAARTVDNTPFALTEAPDDHVLGDDKAPITMIVYASVTCSHCSEWFTNEWPAVKKDLIDSGKIRFVFRELPTQPQQMSMVGFMMAECAPSKDYFDVVQYQMENQLEMFKQAEIGKVREEYNKVGKLAGLENEEAIQACFQDVESLSHIHTNGDRATAAKVQGVPAFFINGDTYKGGQSADALIEVILEMSEKGLSTLPTTLP